jgi:hypothetical protein
LSYCLENAKSGRIGQSAENEIGSISLSICQTDELRDAQTSSQPLSQR